MAAHANKPPYVLQHTAGDGQTFTVCQINRNTKRGKYTFRSGVPQAQYVDEIELSGFTSLPAGLKRRGAGLTGSGYLILKALDEALDSFTLEVSADDSTRVSKSGKVYAVTIKHSDLRAILSALQQISSEKYNEQVAAVNAHMSDLFPRHFETTSAEALTYKAGQIKNLLGKRSVLGGLSKDDIDSLADFYAEFLKKYSQDVDDPKRLVALTKNKKAAEQIYLDKIVKEFATKLNKKLSENKWQEFLRNYILIFNSNYARSLEKESVAIHGRYPDFVLVDAYNYLDIYEIKRPDTPLLKYDESHENYYWDAEIAKAISQTENYIAHAERLGPALSQELRERKGIEVRVLKPRGFIIAGQRKQLSNEAMENNFRLLNNSLKNIQVILYDDLLTNLRTFLTRLKEGERKKKGRKKITPSR